MSEAPRQIADLAELAGKTIARATRANYDARMAIVFTDETYLFVRADCGYEGDVDLEIDEEIDIDDRVAFGVATPEEIKEVEERKRIETQQNREWKDRQDREDYERLRAKFEPGGDRP